MKNNAGIVCIVIGVLLLSGALILAMFNMYQDVTARDTSADILSRLIPQIKDNSTVTVPPVSGDEFIQDVPPVTENEIIQGDLEIPPELLTDEDKKMTEVEIDGYAYIGYLSIPSLGLELPIMSSWSYPQMKLAPCRYFGSVRGEDLVLMAHNYTNHFGMISRLNVEDTLSFTDMDGVTTLYKVVAMDILASTAVEEMTAGEFDLTLFTCTYDGQSRITVCCDKVS